MKICNPSILSVGAIFALLAGCGESGGGGTVQAPTTTPSTTPTQTTAQKIDALEVSGELPKLDRSADLKGPDTDNDGIRDDVKRYIDALPFSAPQKASLGQQAKALGLVVLTPTDDNTAMDTARRAEAEAIHCIYSQFPNGDGLPSASEQARAIQSVTFNTKPRIQAYLAFSAASDGVVLPSPEGDTCE